MSATKDSVHRREFVRRRAGGIGRRRRAWPCLLAGAACVVLFAVAPSSEAQAANWTATASANWATGAGGGWDGSTNTNNTVANTPGGTFFVASSTATLIASSTTQALNFARRNYAFTISRGSGFALTNSGGNSFRAAGPRGATSAGSLQQANAVDIRFDVDIVTNSFANPDYTNAGDAGRMFFMGDMQQSVAGVGAFFGGNITIGGSNSYSGPSQLRSGSLVLDYGAGGGKDATKFSDTAVLTLGGGLTRVTLAGGAHEEIVGSTTIADGAIYVSRSGGSSSLRMNSVTFSAGASIDFGEASIASTDNSNTNGILGGRATVGGTSWAINSTNGQDGAITALSSFASTFSSDTTNVDVTQSLSPAAFVANTMRFNTAGSQTLTLTGNNRLESGGLLVTSNVGNATTLITGGTLSPTSQLVIHQHNSAGVLNIASNVDMRQGFAKAGAGTVRFSNTTDNIGTTTAPISLQQGEVDIATTANVFGSGTIRFADGTLRNSSGSTLVISNPMILGPNSGSGFVSRLAFKGSNNFVLGGAMTVAGISGGIAAKNLYVDVAPNIAVSTTSATAWTGYSSFTKVGSGTFSVQGSNFSTNVEYPLVVREGTMDFSGNGTMTLGNALLFGGVLQFDNRTTNVNARAGGGAGYHMAGGEMKLIGNATVATSQTTTTGPIYVQPGASVITIQSEGQPTTMTVGTRLGSWAQATTNDGMIGGTMLVRGSALGSGSTGTVGRLVNNSTTVAGVNGYPAVNSNGVRTTSAAIIPWMLADDSATGSGKTFAMYDYPGATTPGNGFRPLYLTGGTAEVATAAGSTQVNYYFSGSGTTTASTGTWSSLQLDSGRTLAASSGTVTITMSVSTNNSGALLSTGAANTIDSSIRLNAGNNNFYVHTVSDLVIWGAITNGSGAFVKGSSGTLTLSGTSNRSTGNTFVNQGVLKVANTNGLYDMSTFTGTAQQQRVITVSGRSGSDTGVLELAGVNWNTGAATAPGIVLQGNNATLRGSGTSSYGNGGAAYLSAYGDVFLEASGTGSVFTLNSPISRDSGLDTTVNVKGAGKVELGAGAGNTQQGTSRGNAAMDWYIGGSRNGNDGWLAVNTSSAVGLSTNTFYVGNGGMLSGTGVIGSAVVVQSGGTISPGNSTGTLTEGATTFESGGRFRFEINNWDEGTAGSTNKGWDLLKVPSLTIMSTTALPFVIDMVSLSGTGSAQFPGPLLNFEPDISGYEWLFVEAQTEIAPFDPGVFQFNVAEFQPMIPAQFSFQVRRGDVDGGNLNQLYITYVPEPGTLALVGVAGAVLALRHVRRRRG